MEVRLFRQLKLAGIHGDHWTDRWVSQLISGVPLGARGCPTWVGGYPAIQRPIVKAKKNERLAHRVVAKGDFQVLADISEVVGKPFG
jgi:hypothetical protein